MKQTNQEATLRKVFILSKEVHPFKNVMYNILYIVSRNKGLVANLLEFKTSFPTLKGFSNNLVNFHEVGGLAKDIIKIKTAEAEVS